MTGTTLKFKDLKSLQNEESEELSDGFPVEVFSPELQGIIQETAKLNFPPEYISAYLLGVISTAIGNSCRIQIKKGYTESAVLYIVIVGNSGTNKTAPLKFAIQPLVNKDKKSYRHFMSKMEEYKAEILKNPVLKETLKPPKLFKYLINDATIESVQKRHSVNSRCLLLFMDELKGFFNNFSRYGKGGSDQQQWLSNYSGMAFMKDRVEDEKTMIIEKPHITIMGGIQPAVFNNLFTKDMHDDGMADRFLVFKPESFPDQKLVDVDVAEDLSSHWEDIVNRILAIPYEGDPNTFTFTDDAKKAFYNWFNLNSGITGNEVMDSINAKMRTYCARFCLILQITKDVFRKGGFRTEVDLESVQNAIRLTEYFRKSAQKMRKEVNLLNPFDLLSEIEKELYNLLPADDFTTSEGQKIMKESGLMGDTKFRTKFLKNKDLFVNVDTGKWRKVRTDGRQD